MAIPYIFKPNMAPATDTPFHTSKRLHKWLPILLWIIVLYKGFYLALGIASAAAADSSSIAQAVAQVLYFCTLPAAVLASSSFDLYKWRRRCLRPLQALLSSIFSILACALMLATWIPCLFSGYYRGWCAVESTGAWPSMSL